MPFVFAFVLFLKEKKAQQKKPISNHELLLICPFCSFFFSFFDILFFFHPFLPVIFFEFSLFSFSPLFFLTLGPLTKKHDESSMNKPRDEGIFVACFSFFLVLKSFWGMCTHAVRVETHATHSHTHSHTHAHTHTCHTSLRWDFGL